MKRITLGKTGLQVSPLCIGTWQLAGPVAFDGKPDGHPDPGKKSVLRLIGELFDRGLNFIDTAEQYGDGEAERRTGEAIASHRHEWIVSTKFGYRVGPGNTRIDDSSPGTIRESIEGSLRRLQTDYIDIYLYHCPPDPADLPEARSLLEKARDEGKIRHFGISGPNLDLIKSLHKNELLDVLQFPVSLLDPQPAITEFVTQHNIGTQLRGIMAQGRLSGKYLAHTPTWKADDNRSQHLAGEDLTRFAKLAECLPDSYTLGQASLRWALDQPGHHSVCLGAKNLADYQSAIAALSLPFLPEDTLRKLETLSSTL